MKRTIFNIYTAAVLVTGVITFTSCGGGKSAKEGDEQTAAADSAQKKEDPSSVEITQEQRQTIGLTLGSLQDKALSGVLKVTGFIDVPPENLVSISTQMGGVVRSIPVLQGSPIKKGQVIAVLENQDYVQLQQDYLDSKSQFELGTTEYERQQTLSKQNVNSTKILQQARANYQSSMARLYALKQRLRLININPDNLTAASIRSRVNIYAPISGYVTKVLANTGKFVNPNDVMMEIVNSNNLHVELNAFEKDADKLKAGQLVRFTLTNDTTERTAKVTLVGKEVNQDKTVRVHSVAQGRFNFLPGTYVKAFIETGKNLVPSLPESAIVNFEGNKYIFVSEGEERKAVEEASASEDQKEDKKNKPVTTVSTFKMVQVSTGTSEGGYAEVQIPSNLDIKGKIVIKGAYDLLSKLKNSEEE